MGAIDHLGWVVGSIEAARDHFEHLLGFRFLSAEAFPGLKIMFLDAGSIKIELLEPEDPASEMGRFLTATGGGIHHIGLAVANVAEALAQAERRGFTLIDQTPRPGSRGSRVGSADPHREDGVLIQYVQFDEVSVRGHR
ncbi:MAG: VOC family protein [Candidatus Dormibacteraceae bacterium]